MSEEYCQEFLESIDDDGDALIDRKELSKFIESGIKLSKESQEKYSQRGEFHKIVVQFFDGVDEVRKMINATGGNSYTFWGSKLSINCDAIDAFKTGHVRVDVMRMIPSVKGAKNIMSSISRFVYQYKLCKAIPSTLFRMNLMILLKRVQAVFPTSYGFSYQLKKNIMTIR